MHVLGLPVGSSTPPIVVGSAGAVERSISDEADQEPIAMCPCVAVLLSDWYMYSAKRYLQQVYGSIFGILSGSVQHSPHVLLVMKTVSIQQSAEA